MQAPEDRNREPVALAVGAGTDAPPVALRVDRDPGDTGLEQLFGHDDGGVRLPGAAHGEDAPALEELLRLKFDVGREFKQCQGRLRSTGGPPRIVRPALCSRAPGQTPSAPPRRAPLPPTL